MESFFSLLQKNVLDRQRWASRLDLRLAIVQWIEGIYHRKRRQRRLGKLTPIEFETIRRRHPGGINPGLNQNLSRP
jgi:transposase InsO family protein